MAKVKEPSPAKAHASLLTDGRDVGATDLLGATDVVLQVHLLKSERWKAMVKSTRKMAVVADSQLPTSLHFWWSDDLLQ